MPNMPQLESTLAALFIAIALFAALSIGDGQPQLKAEAATYSVNAAAE